MKTRFTVWLCGLALIPMALTATEPSDVVVYGATPGGIAAAISAAKGGHSVTLIEPTDRIGGLLTAGLSYTDFRSFEALTGFFHDFARRVEADYAQHYGPNSEQVKSCFRGTHGEPSVNLRVLETMLSEYPTIHVRKEAILRSVETSAFIRGRQRILSIRTEDEVNHEAKFFIDATYEGDLMALAGENFHVGRESRDQYGEPMAGDENGHGDGQVQGYNFRFIMTQEEEYKVMASAPEGYRREDFIGALTHFESGALSKVFAADRSGIFRAHLPLMPNRKTDVNDTPHALIRLSMPDINDAYPTGGAEVRKAIVDQHLYNNVGLLYFLQSDPEVPAEIQDDARSWGFCRDEFPDTNHLPPKLYIREARRLIGQYVFTGKDTPQLPDDARGVLHPDSIAIGDYVHNCHGTGRVGTRYQGHHTGEFYQPIPPYQIPYGIIVPQKTENLLVPVACSASHFGFGALRLEPIWSSLGQAAGWTAHLAISKQTSAQAIDVEQLQERLHQDKSATIYVSDVSPDSPDFAAVQWFGTRGGLHGLHGPEQPKRTSLGGQYSTAHPGHNAELESPLTEPLQERWQILTPLAAEPEGSTRGDWIRQAYATRKP